MKTKFLFLALLALASVLDGRELNPVVELPEFMVRAGAAFELRTFEPVPGGQLPSPPPASGSLALQLSRLPGVSLQRRGAHAHEPLLRGLGGDRVATRFNGLFLPNASPTRTGAPVNFFNSAELFEVDVLRSFPRVAEGPVVSGGLLSVQPAFAAARDGLALWASAATDRDGWSAGFSGGLLRERLRVLAAAQFEEHDDYDTGDGGSVDADFRAWSASAAGWHALKAGQDLSWVVHYARQDLVRNSSLPLDTKDSDYWMLNLEHVSPVGEGTLRLRCGYSRADLFLTSEDRPAASGAPVALVEADAPARSASLSAALGNAPSSSLRFLGGLDLDWQSRDALRERNLLSGRQFRDRIWPDVEEWRPGAFLELEGGWSDHLSWRSGLRVERTLSEAHAADHPVEGLPPAGGSTVRENYAAFNGPAAADTDFGEWTGAGQWVVETVLEPGLTLSGGLAYTVAPPGVGERYRAFLNALGGGFELGNPALDPEHKREAYLRLNASRESFDFGLEVFFADFRDYVQRQVVQDVPRVYSFRNVDARFHGIETGAAWRVLENTEHALTVPVTFALTEGENRDRGRDLPEVPPWEGSLALQYESFLSWGVLRSTFGLRYVDAQDNPDPAINPTFTDAKSYALYNLSFELERSGSWRAGVEVENLFDRLAYDYLQPPVATGVFGPSSGTLSRGDRIPLPGREIRIFFWKSF